MLLSRAIPFLLGIIIFNCGAAVSQTAFSVRNSKLIDSIEAELKDSWCKGLLTYPDEYSRSKLRSDMQIISFLNNAYHAQFMENLNDELGKVRRSRPLRKETVNGLLKLTDIILGGKYLNVRLKLVSIDNVIISKRFSLYSITSIRCGEMQYRLPDLNLFRQHIVKALEFPVRMADYEQLVVTGFNADNIKGLSNRYPGFIFSMPQPDHDPSVQRILNKQFSSEGFGHYSFLDVDKEFVHLINNNRLDVISTLLYSPNYIYAIHAMESLIYLAYTGKASITDAMRRRMEVIRQDKYRVIVRRSDDLYRTAEGYGGLSITESQVITKYLNSIK